MNLNEYLKSRCLITDGAMGTYFEEKYPKTAGMAEEANLTAPDTIKAIHLEYIKSGAQLIRTNTFAANTMFFSDMEQVKAVIKMGYKIAQEAAEESEKEIFIGADIGPLYDAGFLGYEVVMKEYKAICDTFLSCGADIFVFETQSEFTYIKEITEYLKSKKDVFILVQYSIDKSGYTKGGLSAERLIQKTSELDSVDAYGFNCGAEAAHLYQILKDISFPEETFLSVLPNAGYPVELRGKTVYSGNKSYFAKRMEQIFKLGANIMGGCCGTTPVYIQRLSEKFQNCVPQKKKIGKRTIDTAGINRSRFLRKLENGEKPIIAELDPPFQTDIAKTMLGAAVLKECDVDLITLADSPMARARMDAGKLAAKIQREIGIDVMVHVCCRDKNVIAMRSSMLGDYMNEIKNFLVVTGDPVGREARGHITPVFDFNSIRLMQYIKEMNEDVFAKAPVAYGGALNYHGSNPKAIAERMKKKMEAGCLFFLTQPVYSREDIERIAYLKEKTNARILCGIMPLVSYKNASFVANEMQGIRVPKEIIEQYRQDMTKEEAEEAAVKIALELMEQMKETADGYYFITPFNRASLIAKIIKERKRSKL